MKEVTSHSVHPAVEFGFRWICLSLHRSPTPGLAAAWLSPVLVALAVSEAPVVELVDAVAAVVAAVQVAMVSPPRHLAWVCPQWCWLLLGSQR